jgi:hypothetical protein
LRQAVKNKTLFLIALSLLLSCEQPEQEAREFSREVCLEQPTIIKEANMPKPKTITIDDIEYVRKDSINEKAEPRDGMEFKIIRTYSAGVFAGYVESRNGKEVVIRDAIRIWYWSGASSLSQLAVDGTKSPKNCKFAVPVDKIEVTEAVELLDVTQTAKENILSVPSWKN